ncbi:unnamed protein product, partial [Arabidopsis halleri]
MRFDLSFWCPVKTTVFTQTKMPPVLVKSDEEYALFKGRSKDNGGLHMYVTMKKVRREIEAPMEEVDKFGCGNELYEIDIAEDEEMISDTQLLAYVEEIEAVHKSRMAEEGIMSVQQREGQQLIEKGLVDINITNDNIIGRQAGNGLEVVHKARLVEEGRVSRQQREGQQLIEEGLLDINITNDNIIGRQASNVLGSEKGKEIVVLEDNAVIVDVSVDNNLIDENEVTPMDMSSFLDEEQDYNYDEWTARTNRDYPPDWDPYNGGAVKDVEDMALGDTCERGIFELGGPSRECEREVGEQFKDRLAMVDEIVPIRFSLGLEESGDVEIEDENVGEQTIIRAPSDERNMDLKRAGDAIYVGRIFANKAELHKFLSRYSEKAMAKILADLVCSKYTNGKKGPRACE